MPKNVGNIDRTIRLVLGVVILALGFLNQSWWGLVGIIPLATGLMNFCPLYSVLGIRTNGKA